MVWSILWFSWLSLSAAESVAVQRDVADRPRLLVLTDIGGDPDDQQSLIRLMLYTNEVQIEGVIATASGTPGELKQAVTRPDLIREIISAYGRVRENLVLHAEGYPETRDLLAKVKSGNAARGLAAVGASSDTEASQWIIEVVDCEDPRPVNVAIWGGQTDLAQALWRVRQERSHHELRRFVQRLRVYDINDQDRLQGWIFENFPDLFYVLSKAPAGADKRLGAYRGMYLGGDMPLTSKAWLDQHVRTGYGPLGALYPNATWTDPNPHVALKEGDTPSWFYFLPNGLGDPAHPEWGGWGGRFMPAGGHLYRDVADTIDGITEPRASVWRWRPAVQNDFQARMDWCIQSAATANHPPVAILEGNTTHEILTRDVHPGASVRLSAEGSHDPDGDTLNYRWWIYAEAGTLQGSAVVRDATSPVVSVQLPQESVGQSMHVILDVTDSGTPPLTAYRRLILQIRRQ